jgi:hypothetical protein
MSEINYSGEPNSCNCRAFPTPHSHLDVVDDGKSHNIRPDVKGLTGTVYGVSVIHNKIVGEERVHDEDYMNCWCWDDK